MPSTKKSNEINGLPIDPTAKDVGPFGRAHAFAANMVQGFTLNLAIEELIKEEAFIREGLEKDPTNSRLIAELASCEAAWAIAMALYDTSA